MIRARIIINEYYLLSTFLALFSSARPHFDFAVSSWLSKVGLAPCFGPADLVPAPSLITHSLFHDPVGCSNFTRKSCGPVPIWSQNKNSIRRVSSRIRVWLKEIAPVRGQRANRLQGISFANRSTNIGKMNVVCGFEEVEKCPCAEK